VTETSKPEKTTTVNELRADSSEKRLDVEILQDIQMNQPTRRSNFSDLLLVV